MSLGKRSDKKTYAGTWIQCASGVDVDLVALSPDKATCAEYLVLLAAGTFTKLIDVEGNDRPISVSLPANYKHERDVQVANCTAAFLAYF